MPCKPSPKTLKQFCLDSVALNLEMLCYGTPKGSKALAEIIESDRFKEYASPFIDWPAQLLEDLSRTIYSKRAGLKHLMYHVIQSQITDYSIFIHGSIHVVMELLSRRCRDLRSLEMTYSVNLPPIYYVEFFGHFPKLTRLNVYGSMVDDNGFDAIGEYCVNLVELIASKTWITDLGMQRISKSATSDKALCPKLRVLSVLETRVTPAGLATFLACHPKTLKLEHGDSMHLFQYLFNDETSYDLVSLCSTSPHLTPKMLTVALERCPRVETVAIFNPGCLVDEALYKLMTLKHLRSLHISNNGNPALTPGLTFREGIEPVLVGCGATLRKLVLEHFAEFDVVSVAEKCPELQHLALSSILYLSPMQWINPDLFQRLTDLEIWSCERLCPMALKQLTANCSDLKCLLMQNVPSLTDDVFLDLLNANPMLNLGNVVFDQCHGITAKSLWKLLELPNALRILRAWNCKGVSDTDRDNIKNAIKESNLALYWEWYPYLGDDVTNIVHDWQEYEVDQ